VGGHRRGRRRRGGAAAVPVVTGSASGACLASADCYPKPVNSGVGATGIPAGHTLSTSCTTNPSSGQVLTDCLFTNGETITTTGAGATYRYSEFQAPVIHAGTGTLTYEYSNFGLTSGCSTYDAMVLGPDYTVRYSRFNVAHRARARATPGTTS
jgi:hypothetical protein